MHTAARVGRVERASHTPCWPCVQAKVILTVRHSFDVWYDSCLKTVWAVMEVRG